VLYSPKSNHATAADEIKVRAGVIANALRQSVTRAGLEVALSRQQFQMFVLISFAKHGTTPERLFDVIYASSIDGGPLTGRKAMAVQRVNLNRRLAPIHLKISSGGPGRAGGIYELCVMPMGAVGISDGNKR
jgi:hypothetical protein